MALYWYTLVKTNPITKNIVHPNFDITNDRVRLLLFTISRNSLYRDFVNSKGSWHLFTISRNSLYQDSLYQSLGYLGLVWPAVVWSADDIHFSSIFTYFQYSLIHDLALYITIDLYMIRGPDIDVTAVKGYLSNF